MAYAMANGICHLLLVNSGDERVLVRWSVICCQDGCLMAFAKGAGLFLRGTANQTWGDIFESSELKARTSLLPRFSKKRSSSFEL